ncbi:NADH-quinone oxidoreductase subunit D [Candidatus Xenohaliotis californiensis]|uniref:NADH-quinone oxidoreductase subunit D n=1 Tax=Candidatus Xenohaliotis californiensis TaxID=84677 RepID=UPI0030C814A1
MKAKDKDKFIVNFGPQHPASHGVLRLVLELDGEIIDSSNTCIGYLHRGTEKLIEHKTYLQALPYFDRMDYVAPLIQEYAYVLCVERIYGCPVPIRAQYLRVMFSELTRILNHFSNIGAHALDAGATTPMLLLCEEREKILSFLERASGARMHMSYFRFGGIINDVSSKLLNDILSFLDETIKVVDNVETLLTENRIWKQRNVGIGIISKKDAIKWGCSGPILRATGVPRDLRKATPYDIYNVLDFSIPVTYNGDCYDRYMIRVAEVRQSVSMVKQCIEKVPSGEVICSDRKIAPESDLSLIHTSMEAMIAHFKLYSEGFSLPSSELYTAVESPKGEFGVYLVADGTNKPYRCRIRSPNFAHLQMIDSMARGYTISDLSVILGSLDIVMGEVDR